MKNSLPLLALALVVFTGCGKPHVDPEFSPYVADFQRVLNEQNVAVTADVSVEFGDLSPEPGEMAVCTQSTFGSSRIVVDRAGWNSFANSTGEERRMIIFHELGHCVLDRKHDETLLENGEPESIMYPNALRAAVSYSIDPSYYEKELVRDAPTTVVKI